MADTNKKLPKTLFPFLWHFLRPYKPAVCFFVILSFAAGFWGPFNSILIKNIIDLLPQAHETGFSIVILPAALIVINFIVFDNFTWRFITYIRSKFIPRIINNIISEIMAYVLSHAHQFFQDNLSGKISKQITNLTDGAEKLFTNIAANFIRGFSLLLTAFITAYFVNPLFSFILITWVIIFVSVSVFMSKKVMMLSDAQASAESTVVGELVDSISNQSNVRIFARKNYEVSRINPALNRQKTAYCNTYFYALIMHSIQGGLIAIMMAFSAYTLIYLYKKGLVSIGDFALIFGLSMETGHLMWATMAEVDEFNKAVGKCKQSLLSLRTPLAIKDIPNAKPLVCDKGHIAFNKVTFSYDKGPPLFHDMSIKIQAGQKIGLVGYSGGGKSTFANLILRLYEVIDGMILIDNQDISNITQDSLYQNIAMIPQDPSLFHRSLMDNIRYGRVDATDEDVIDAAQKAHAHEFIMKLPNKYNTLVGERGIKLSGGQRQRIAIARAFLKNTPILILDEATSQLDSVTENMIQDSLQKLMQRKTTIIIAHRLSTLIHMDRILVFEKGKIVEDGTHESLLKKESVYKKLWTAQVGGFLGDKK